MSYHLMTDIVKAYFDINNKQ